MMGLLSLGPVRRLKQGVVLTTAHGVVHHQPLGERTVVMRAGGTYREHLLSAAGEQHGSSQTCPSRFRCRPVRRPLAIMQRGSFDQHRITEFVRAVTTLCQCSRDRKQHRVIGERPKEFEMGFAWHVHACQDRIYDA